MANEKLIYASDARRAILKADPRLAYLIDNIKGVDAVEVVRCKDCKQYEEQCHAYGYCYHWDYEQGMSPNSVDPDDFCSYGERREGE